MAGRLADRPDFNIPETLIDKHEWVVDASIDTLGDICQLVYPPIDSECPNCEFDIATGRSTNVYKQGGPYSFPAYTLCPFCSGEGRLTQSSTENIRLRVYYNTKDWVKFGGLNLVFSDSVAQIIGYMTDLPKIERCQYIILNSRMRTIREWKVVRNGEAIPWGFRADRYFLQMMKRAGG